MMTTMLVMLKSQRVGVGGAVVVGMARILRLMRWLLDWHHHLVHDLGVKASSNIRIERCRWMLLLR
jgi:hypothetical protein